MTTAPGIVCAFAGLLFLHFVHYLRLAESYPRLANNRKIGREKG